MELAVFNDEQGRGVVIDALGRRLTMRGPLGRREHLQIVKAIGLKAADAHFETMAIAMLVGLIDARPLALPKTRRGVSQILARLGTEGLEAVQYRAALEARAVERVSA